MPEYHDDKSQHCIPFLLEHLKAHRARHGNNADAPPFFLGLNGVQGAGKTVLVLIEIPASILIIYVRNEINNG